MSDQFLGEIRIFPFGFAPLGWALCSGQVMLIQQNTTLFSLIGNNYGGDGVRTFALPDLEANVPVCVSHLAGTTSPPLGPGLSTYDLGQFGGEQTHTLLDAENAPHSHNINADTNPGQSASPANAIYNAGVWTGTPPGLVASFSAQAPDVVMNPLTVGINGGGQPHNNMMPYLTLNFCIALSGIYPQRP